MRAIGTEDEGVLHSTGRGTGRGEGKGKEEDTDTLGRCIKDQDRSSGRSSTLSAVFGIFVRGQRSWMAGEATDLGYEGGDEARGDRTRRERQHGEE